MQSPILRGMAMRFGHNPEGTAGGERGVARPPWQPPVRTVQVTPAACQVCSLHISVYLQSIFSLYSVYVQSMFSVKVSLN